VNAPVPVALLTYTVKPRGGVVHTLALAEALHDAGYPVRVFVLGDPDAGFYRPVRAPFTLFPAPPALPTLEDRVFASVAALADGLASQVGAYPIMHAQDCISARAACSIRDRTIHDGGRAERGPLVRALAALRESGRDPVLAIVGDPSFPDYRAYVDRVLAMLPGLGLRLGRDVVRLGTVPDAELPAWYARRTCSRSLRPRRAGGSRSWRP
jgi:hypothetical protein